MGVGKNISKIIFFCKCRQIRLKLVIFLFYDLPVCNKRAEILPSATALMDHLRSQFNDVFALLIPMPRFNSIIKMCLKISYFCKKMQKFRALWGSSPDSRTHPSHSRFLATRLSDSKQWNLNKFNFNDFSVFASKIATIIKSVVAHKTLPH